MTAKEYLTDYTALKREAEDLKHRVEELREKRLYIKSLDMSSAASGGTRKDISDTVAAIDNLIAKYLRKIMEFISIEAEILETIERIKDPIERDILTLRYIQDKDPKTGKPYTWLKIAERVNYSERSAQYKHGEALISYEVAAAEKKKKGRIHPSKAATITASTF